MGTASAVGVATVVAIMITIWLDGAQAGCTYGGSDPNNKTIIGFQCTNLEGATMDFRAFAGKVVLIENVASM